MLWSNEMRILIIGPPFISVARRSQSTSPLCSQVPSSEIQDRGAVDAHVCTKEDPEPKKGRWLDPRHRASDSNKTEKVSPWTERGSPTDPGWLSSRRQRGSQGPPGSQLSPEDIATSSPLT